MCARERESLHEGNDKRVRETLSAMKRPRGKHERNFICEQGKVRAFGKHTIVMNKEDTLTILMDAKHTSRRRTYQEGIGVLIRRVGTSGSLNSLLSPC